MSEITKDVPVENTEEATPGISLTESGDIKLDMSVINQPAPEQEPEAVVEIKQTTPEPVENITEEVIENVEEPVNESFIEEITEEEVVEQVEELEEQIEQAVVEQSEGVVLPENIQKVVDFMEETNGTLEDYVMLNQDYSKLNETQLLKEYYERTKPHLEKEDIEFLMEDNFSYDEDVDDDRDIRRKKLAHREELAKAKSHLDGMKSKYYEEIKGGSKLAPEQKKAVDFFNRYKKENEEAAQVAKKQADLFNNRTNNVFNEDFKGFDYKVGDKKFRFKVKDSVSVKETQSDINNFIKKFLNDKNEMSDAKGYHKGLFTAMNSDAIAEHFYEQGKADAMKTSISKSKNINMGARGVHEDVKTPGGWSVRSVDSGGSDSKLRVKSFKHIK
tara:strand:- start:138 stop:1301 length:1164 start_codon:yes stop_codon:yes gene_type:complete